MSNRVFVPICLAFAALTAYLLWPMAADRGSGREPHPVVAKFRLASVNGIAVGRINCPARMRRGRMLLGADGSWWLRETPCGRRWSTLRTGTYRWSGDTMIVTARRSRRNAPPLHRSVLRGDTLTLYHSYHPDALPYRYVRLRPAAP